METPRGQQEAERGVQEHAVNVLREERLPSFMANGWSALHERLFLSVLSALLDIDALTREFATISALNP
jgi:hypothetical protein